MKNEEKLRCPICLVGQLQWQYVEGIGADMWKCTDAGRGWNADQSVYGYCGISLEEPVIMEAMKIGVVYENTKTGEYEKYTTTFQELIDEFGGMLDEKIVIEEIIATGEAILNVGYATTTVRKES